MLMKLMLVNLKKSLRRPRKVEDRWTLSCTGVKLSQNSLSQQVPEVDKLVVATAVAEATAVVVMAVAVEAAAMEVAEEAAAMAEEAEVKALEVAEAVVEAEEMAAEVVDPTKKPPSLLVVSHTQPTTLA